MRYFDTKTRTEVFAESKTTIDSMDERVKAFFEKVPEDKALSFNEHNLPVFDNKVVVSKEELDLASAISEYKSYLLSTDWYYARKMETDEEVPTEVIEKRKAARTFLRNNDK
ncbi:MAG: hypothetical protein HOM18_03000 [Candidatus Marinimicrobia bacterium]|nr:hypothetical protein [Candidatus Neomarinimicrobiota bacterium]